MAYKAISDYGIIGDLRTAALISRDGAVGWFCLPRFDSPSVFAAILDEKRGGRFTIAPSANGARCQQLYQPDTNILVTRFLAHDAALEVTDFMPLRTTANKAHCSRLVRRVKAVCGSMAVKVECIPAFHYACQKHEVELNAQGASFHSADLSLQLATSAKLNRVDSGITAEFTLQESQTISFVLGEMREGCVHQLPETELDELEEKTAGYWRNWLMKCTYKGRWQEIVHRSALLLELLTYSPTGAIIAAPTCSLPEWIGGDRNWDYRYNWIRDAAYTVYALLRVGLFDESTRFLGWIEERCAELAEQGALQTVYAIDGKRDLNEQALDSLDGYRGSRPVRVGNNAFQQTQLDIYGALIDAVYLYNRYVQPITGLLWRDVRRLVNWVCDNWRLDDHGIWELRGEPRQLVHSKMMCWVALDRGVRLARSRSLPADHVRWLTCRDQIYEEVVSRGWNEQKRSFVQSYGSNALDASVLMMPLVFFMTPDDPRMVSTVEAISQPLSKGGLLSDGMLYRYQASTTDDGMRSNEGTFNVCTLWLIEALTRMGRSEQAHWLFEKVLSRANHLGLYSEETGLNGEQLGNFPQAFTHMGLISAACKLNETLGD